MQIHHVKWWWKYWFAYSSSYKFSSTAWASFNNSNSQ